MKIQKFLNEKILALVLVLVVLGVTYYFYQQGGISFLPRKESVIRDRAAEIPFSGEEYQLSYQDKSDSAFNIADFEDNENWHGNYEFDYMTLLEGESSIFLESRDHEKAVLTLKKKFDFEDFSDFKFFVYLGTDSGDIEEFNLIFKGRNVYKFPIRDLLPGWNFLVLAKENFSVSTALIEEDEETFSDDERIIQSQANIQEIAIELVSRPKTRSIVNLDSLWAEEKGYLEDWNIESPKFLSMKRYQDSIGLLVVGLVGKRATLKKIPSAQNYTFQAKFVPVQRGGFGLFVRSDYNSGDGYYLMMGGIESDGWQIKKHGPSEKEKQSLVLAKGRVGNFKMEKNKPYWLKAEMKGSRIIFHLSLDGENFSKIGEARDESFLSGGVGIASFGGSVFFVDEIQFFQ